MSNRVENLAASRAEAALRIAALCWHDLLNDLSVIHFGFSALELEQHGEFRHHPLRRQITDGLRRATEMVESLRLLTHSPEDPSMDLVGVAELMRAVNSLARPHLQRCGIHLQIVGDSGATILIPKAKASDALLGLLLLLNRAARGADAAAQANALQISLNISQAGKAGGSLTGDLRTARVQSSDFEPGDRDLVLANLLVGPLLWVPATPEAGESLSFGG